MTMIAKARQNRLNALASLRSARSGKSAAVMDAPMFRSRRTADNLNYAPDLMFGYRVA